MNNDLKIGNNVYVETPSHGFVEAKIFNITKSDNKTKSVSIKYTDDFIKETYGDNEVIYNGSKIQKIISDNKNRPFYWLFQNRKDFPEWVTETFMKYDSCKKNDKNTKNTKNNKEKSFYLLPRQKFIRDYLGHESPYRGLLLYHGLGSGKTCASIAVSENLKDTRNIVIMLPASIKDNFISEGLKKCGDKNYKTLNGDQLIKDKYTFVTYNSVTAVKQIEDIGALNNKVIIVDEVHNLATRMVNGLRGTGKQGYDLYKHLFNAKNSKIVFLTGTPLVNTPFEIAVLFNILRGPIEVIAFRISNFSEDTIDNYIAELIKNERIGWVELERRNQSLLVIMKLNSWDMEFEQTIRFIEFTARKYDAYVNYERTDSYPLFPETEEEFESFFVKDDNFINKDMFQRRIVGLTSFYETSKKDIDEFPEQLPTKIIKVKMSNHQFELYQQGREIEKRKEKKVAQQIKQKKGDKVTTLARIYSRAMCNFAFPDNIIKPGRMKFMTAILKEKIEKEQKEKGEYVEENEKNKYEEKEKITKETLDKQISEALIKLSDPAKPFLKKGPNGLSRYSPKMEEMLEEINKDTRGLILIYSSFRTVEGLEIFSRVLKANGYELFNNSQKDEKYEYKRFAFYSGQEDLKIRKEIVSTFTDSDNKHGKNLRILLISAAGAEGLNLKNIRKVLIMDVFWHDVRIQQIIGRAVRKQSHYDLPENERNVQPFIYITVFTPKQEENSREKLTTDEYIHSIALKKLRLNNDVLQAVKESAIDCELNQCDSKRVCYKFFGIQEGLAYLPKIQDDIVYGYQHSTPKEVKKDLFRAGITANNELLYKKGKDWFYGNGKKYTELKGKPELVNGKIYAIDTAGLIVYDYDSVKKKTPIKIGKINEIDGKLNEL
jgi:superfamily II DNA or RNA helicase